MKSAKSIPWIVAALPWLGMVVMFAEMARAAAVFGRAPRYLHEADPFASGLDGPLSGYVSLGMLMAPLLLLLWGVVLCLPAVRYRGQHRWAYFSLVTMTALMVCAFTVWDVTGYLRWVVD